MLDLQGYEASILKGALVTIEVAVLSLILAMVLGMLGALAKLAPYKWARAIATLYTTVIRGIPDLVLMMLIFFGGQILLNNSLYSINETLNEWLPRVIQTMNGRLTYLIILMSAHLLLVYSRLVLSLAPTWRRLFVERSWRWTRVN